MNTTRWPRALSTFPIPTQLLVGPKAPSGKNTMVLRSSLTDPPWLPEALILGGTRRVNPASDGREEARDSVHRWRCSSSPRCWPHAPQLPRRAEPHRDRLGVSDDLRVTDAAARHRGHESRPGDEVSSPLTIRGNADVFEATVSISILDAAGNEFVRAFTTATCDT
ncbi:MAG: Gmad2 immunoglobulin-like domain-containing protein [Actinomycetota bacterium]